MKNLIKTTSKEYKEKMFKFLLDSIEFEDIDTELTDRQKLDYFFNEFNNITNYPNNLKRYPAESDRLADYLQGLPSSINLPFYNYDILEFAKKLHNTNELTEKEEDKILSNYWSHIAIMLIRLRNKLTK